MSLPSDTDFSTPRVEKRYSAWSDLSVGIEGLNENIPVRTPDMSTSGMFINTPREFPYGSVLKISFRLPHVNYTVQARAEVRYCLRDVGIGVEFINLSDEARHAIETELDLHG